jgi:methionyl aminopeptidase
MILSSPQQAQTYREAARISTEIMAAMRDAVKPGVYPIEIDELAGKLCEKNSVRPAFQGVTQSGHTYHHNSCISVNEEILHGIPSDKRAFQAGDLVKLDFGIVYQELHTDHCVTVGIHKISLADQQLLDAGKIAVLKAVTHAVAGNRTGDLGFAMQKTANRAGFEVLKQYIGHGIGTTLHDDPEIPAWGKKGRGELLKENMVICVEAQVVAGSDQVFIEKNNWTVKTRDGKKGVMFEYMVLVGKNEPEILTDTVDWPLVV